MKIFAKLFEKKNANVEFHWFYLNYLLPGNNDYCV